MKYAEVQGSSNMYRAVVTYGHKKYNGVCNYND